MLSVTSFGQVNSDSKKFFTSSKCYNEHFDDKLEDVFTKTEISGCFKGSYYAFLDFLISHINFKNIVADLKQNEPLYSDTATIKFIISKKGTVSDLTIVGTKREVLRQELFEVIKKSACYWIPGSFNGIYVAGWLQLKIFFTMDRGRQEFSTNVGYEIN